MTTTPLPPAGPPSVAADFPVEWSHPDDADRLWTWDRRRWPDPVSPLAFSVLQKAFTLGTGAAARALAAPIGDLAVRRVNTYLYLGGRPPPPAAAEEMAASAARSQGALDAAMAGLRETWEREYLPEIHLHLAAWEAFDLPGAGTTELLAHLDDTVIRFARLMELHFLAVFPASSALSALDELVRRLDFGDGDPDGGRLVAGFPDKTAEAGQALWRLSRTVRDQPGVLAKLVSRWPATTHLLTALADTPDGAEFLAALRRYLESYGQRGGRCFDFDRASWLEDPTPVLERLRALVAQPDDEDPARHRQEQAADREQARAQLRGRLAGAPPEATERFEFLLTAASTGAVITEDHRFWIDFRAAYKVRRVLMEFGWRLVPDAVNVPDDVFLLTLDELRQTAGAERTPDCRELVEARRAEMARFAGVQPPPRLGTPGPLPAGLALAGVYCAPTTT